MPDRPRILAIDAGYRCLGWAIVEVGATLAEDHVLAAGAIVTAPPSKDARRGVRVADAHAERCAQIARELDGLRIEWGPRAVVCELPHGGAQSATAMAAMARASAIVATCAQLWGMPAEWTTPDAGKLAAAGSRGASKADVIAGVARQLGWLDHAPRRKADREGAADACAAYLAARDGQLVRSLRIR